MLLFQSASSKKPVSHIFPSRLYTPRQWHTGAGLLLACRSWFCPYCPNSMFRAAMSAAWNQPQCIYTITTAQRYKGRIPSPCQRWVTGTHSGERLACAVVPDILQILLSQPPKCIFRSHFVHHIRWLCLVRSVPVTPGFTEESAGHDLLSSPPQWERRSGSLYLEVTWPRSHVTSLNWPKKVMGYTNLRRAKGSEILSCSVKWGECGSRSRPRDCRLTHKLDPGNQRVLTPSPVLGMSILPTVSIVEAVPRTQPWKSKGLSRPSGRYTWPNPVQASV